MTAPNNDDAYDMGYQSGHDVGFDEGRDSVAVECVNCGNPLVSSGGGAQVHADGRLYCLFTDGAAMFSTKATATRGPLGPGTLPCSEGRAVLGGEIRETAEVIAEAAVNERHWWTAWLAAKYGVEEGGRLLGEFYIWCDPANARVNR